MRALLLVLLFACSGKKAPPAEGSGSSAGSGSAAIAVDAAAAVVDAPVVVLDAPPVPPDTAPAEPAVPDDVTTACENACTDYAGCWEQVNKGRDFRGGSACVTACEERTPADRTAWIKSVSDALSSKAKCKELVGD